MILNKTTYPLVWTSCWKEIQWKTYRYNSFPEYWMDYLDIEGETLFYVEFMGIDTFMHYTVEEYVPLDIVEKIRAGEVTLMLHCTGHGPLEVAEEVYKHVIKRDRIPYQNLILSSECADMDTAVEWYRKKHLRLYGTEIPTIRTRIGLEFEAYATHWAQSGTHRDSNLDYFKFENKNYTKKYMCLNGYYRDHRAITVFLLAAQNLLDQGYVSFNIKDGPHGTDGREIYDRLLTEIIQYNDETKMLFTSSESKLVTLGSILLDTEYNQENENLADLKPDFHNKLFNDTYFSILTETNFPIMRYHQSYRDPNVLYDNVGRLYSEKIFRCILYKHPFIAVGCPYFLEGLRTLGYKTFDSIIDESYDTETDDLKRLLKIAKEAKRLCELDQTQLADFLSKTKEICEYNFEVLKNKTKFGHDLPFRV